MYIKNPHGRHKSFRLFEKKQTVKNEVLDSINKRYVAGAMPFETARAAVEALRKELSPKVKSISWLPDNQSILEEYWEKSSGGKARKHDRSKSTARQRLQWGVKHLGQTSIRSDRDKLQAAFAHLSNNQKIRAYGVVNEICRYLRIPVPLKAPKKQKLQIDYLTIEELEQVLRLVENPAYKLFFQVAFGTGARTGEIYSFTHAALRQKGTHIFINEQKDKSWNPFTVKNEIEGSAYIVSSFRLAVKQWLMVPIEVRKQMRASSRKVYDVFKEATAEALKRDLTIHNLRHSYAKYMLEQGATLIQLRGWMRDRLSTIENYYLKWEQSSSEMEISVRLFG